MGKVTAVEVGRREEDFFSPLLFDTTFKVFSAFSISKMNNQQPRSSPQHGSRFVFYFYRFVRRFPPNRFDDNGASVFMRDQSKLE